MQVAVRSYFTAGVALAGAGVIAVSPVAPIPTDIHLPAVNASSAAVALNALTSPLDAWAQTLTNAGANLQALGEQLVANPAPILQTVISNQVGNATVVGDAFQVYGTVFASTLQSLPAALQTASDLIAQGQITEAMDGLTGTLLPAIVGVLDLMNNTWSSVSTTTQNIENVIKAVPTLVQSVGLPSLFPVLSVLNGVAATAQDVVTAANAGDAEGVANAFINAPANLTDAFLNGKGTILGFIDVPGLLSPTSPFGFLGSGPIASAIDLPNTIAGLLKPNPLAPTTATVAATAAPLSTSSSVRSAQSVTLSIPAAGAVEDTAPAAVKDAAPVAVNGTGAAADSDAAAQSADAVTPSTDDSTSVTTSRVNPKSPTKTARDNIRNAAKRISGKLSGKSSKNAGSASASSRAHDGGKPQRKRGGDHD